ncbi:hypothetical protein E5676_scaffold156G00420 [Cucumis melo var. makuwa]|uniref:Uncharacterized protein n=1 Tax=Cucumis melo var. makuwa TaxID=1194695 RepID=A0A5D3BG29_CUCMM|nr:hypothetical protein E5676_scaffold156G00420 [Cucumis melo var. makuwa]
MALLFSLEGSAELTLKFSGSAADLVGVSFLSLGRSVERGFRSRGITEFQVRVFLLLDPESSYGLVCIKYCSGCGSWSLDGEGHTRLICVSFGSTRLICAFYGTTRLLCRVTARGRPTRGRKDA